MHFIIICVWLGLMLVMLSLVWQVFKAHPRQKLRDKYRLSRKHKFHAKVLKASFTSPGYAGVWHQLLKLVRFDIAAAERLVASNQRKYPNKSDRWCIEKAIWDLESDRSAS